MTVQFSKVLQELMRIPARTRARVLFSIQFLACLLGLLSGGCRISEPYLIPRRSIELLSSLQPNSRPHAKVPAVRQEDRAPVLIDYRALQINDEELARINAHPARFYRMRAAQRHPLVLIGGVILGMALPHFLVGLAVGLDKPSDRDERAITDVKGGVLMLTVAGLHIATGITLIGIGERNPRIEPADTQLLYQYMNPER